MRTSIVLVSAVLALIVLPAVGADRGQSGSNEGWKISGGSCVHYLSEAGSPCDFRVATYRNPGGNVLLRFENAASGGDFATRWERAAVLDELLIPEVPEGYTRLSTCRITNAPETAMMGFTGIVKYPGHGGWHGEAIWAVRPDRGSGKFELIAPDDVECHSDI